VPQGARDGLPAARSNQFRANRNKDRETLEQCSIVWIEDRETLVSIAQGGGGYGDPWTRDPDRVLHDVREGIVSRARAEEVYGVIIADNMSVDVARTTELRSA
jgi:N-methylhydantoinase B